jgi:chromosome segregation ATPase
MAYSFRRDPRLVPLEPYYPSGEIAILQEEKKMLKKQADDLYIYKEHLKKELEKSKELKQQIAKELENKIAENIKNIEKIKSNEITINTYKEYYLSEKRKLNDTLNEYKVSAEKKYKNLDKQYTTLENDYYILKDKYNTLEKEHKDIDISKNTINTKNFCARLCYNGKKCKRYDCKFAHSTDELDICPQGERCDKKKCIYVLHSEIGRMLFREHYRGKDDALCSEYDKYNSCYNANCNKIHFDFNTRYESLKKQ